MASKRPETDFDTECDTTFATYSPLVRRLLRARAITTQEEAERFLNPEWERDTFDPFTMKDMQRAVDRIMSAVEQSERIVLWSDYDMDGIPGAVLLYDLFSTIGYSNVHHYTPHRNREGFGLNKGGLNEVAHEGTTLIITIDCGIGDIEHVEHARKAGIDVIITDHHIPGDTLPQACAILNPKQNDCVYGEKMLSGAGVAFKLAQAILTSLRERPVKSLTVPTVGWEKWLLDMAGMATVADMVPLVGENRALAHFGLIVLRKSRRLGLQALLKKARTDQRSLTEDDIAFTIAPRVNAASRMGHAKDAFALLSATDPLEAELLAQKLDDINSERKVVVATMKREIQRKLDKRGVLDPVIVLGNPDWKPSLLGLVAGSLVETYDRPVFLWGREDSTVIKGSCRSDGTCSVFDLMYAVRERFIEYGGHVYSGGFSLHDTHVHTLGKDLSEVYEQLKQDTHHIKEVHSGELSIDDVTEHTYREVARFAPFGVGNERPVFLFRDAELSLMRTFGKAGEHIELSFKKRDGRFVKVIRFFTSPDFFPVELSPGVRVSFTGFLEASNFAGRRELRVRLVSIHSDE